MNKENYVSLEMAKILYKKGFEIKGTYLWTRGVLCPTLYEVQKWLREVHNIHVMIGVDDLDWWYQLYDCSEDGRMEETNHFSGSVACQKSYEEALNNGIFDALKLI